MSDSILNVSSTESGSGHPEPVEGRWTIWGRSVFAVAVVAVLIVLGVANIGMHARWHEVEDGVLWTARAEGVTAAEVAAGSAAEAAGIQRGDVLLAVNGSPVQTPGDVVEYQHRSHEGTRLSYTLLRLGTRQGLDVSLAPAPQKSSMYFVLAAVGLFTLLVGAAVRLRRPRDQATLHFFWLCVAFFGAFTFSFNGPFDRLDWVFYWGDAVAMALLPPLLLHFTLVFPQRPSDSEGRPRSAALVPLMYLPALALGAARIVAVARGSSNGPLFSRAIDLLDRAEPVYLFLCGMAALVVLLRAFRQITSLTARRQLRWIAWGTALGVGPFAFGYGLPWALGIDPPLALQLTAIPLSLVPLTFASAIVRYRLRDVEVIIKGGLAYTAFFSASAILYVAILKLTRFFFANDADEHTWIVALLATIIVVLLAQPVKDAVQNALDRVFYRDRFDYRRALLGFARDLNNDLDVVRLSQRLVTRIVETLVVDRMALMLADERSGDFTAIGDFGFTQPVPRLWRGSSLLARLDAGHTIALDDPIAAARFVAEEVEYWRDAGIYYFVPCVFEGGAIAVLALGRKESDEAFNSEDLALLTSVAGQVATAIENGRLYRQLHLKAEELGRMREFNENILESLDDGLVVFDADERIVRWNRALESFLRRCALQRDRSKAFRCLRPAVRGGAAGGAGRKPARRDAVSRAAGGPTSEWGRQRPVARARERDDRTAAESVWRFIGGCRHDSPHRGHHRPRPSRRAAPDFRKDGVDRPSRRRRGTRGEHAAHRHFELHADAARGRRSERSQDRAAREDRASDVPRGEDRQRSPQPLASRDRDERAHARGPERRHHRCLCASGASIRGR